MSSLGDLTTKVRRFGKTPNTVPGTYMSAAGVQTEIHPTTLARLAVHETYYRRKLHIYQQDLENTVHKIRKEQIMMKRSFGEYKRKLTQNQKNKYVSPFHSASVESNLSTSTWSAVSEPVQGEVKVVRRGGKKVKIVLPPLKRAVSERGHATDEEDSLTSRKPEYSIEVEDGDTIEAKGGETGINVTSTERLQGEESVENEEEKSGHHAKEEENNCKQFSITNKKGGIETARKTKKVKGKNTDRKHPSKNSVNFEESVISKSEQDPDEGNDNAEEDSSSTEKVGSTGFVTDKDAVLTVISNTKPPRKNNMFAHPKKPDSDTSSFMELVRMKNKHGLVKNMKVVDELIQHSRTRSFAYLTKVTESREDLLKGESKEERDNPEFTDDRQIASGHKKPGVIAAGTDEVDHDTDESVTVSEMLSIDGSPRQTNGGPRQGTKTNIIVAPDTDRIPFIGRDGTNYSLFSSRNPSQLLPGRSQLRDVPISMRVSLPPSTVDKFLKDEKAKSSNYKSDMSWQQSLAVIRDVHYIRNKDDFQDFAKGVIDKTGK